MAGTLAFYNGMMPGITRAMSSLADDSSYGKGYALQANAMHDMASARKANADTEKTLHEIRTGDDAALDYVMGSHGLTKQDFEDWRNSRRNGTMPAGSSAGPGFSPEQMQTRNNALRDYAAMMTRKPGEVGKFATEMAQLPSVQASVAAAQRGDEQSAADIIRHQAALGKDVMKESSPSSINEFNMFSKMTPQQQQAFLALQTAKRPAGTTINMPNATYYGTDPATGRSGMFQIGKDGKQIFTPIDPPPPSNPVDAEIAKRLKERQTAGGPPPVKSGSTPAGIPPGAKQVGTSGGKPVYEINGKRYIAE